MLRRDFIKVVTSLAAASAAVKATIAATKTPEDRVGEYFRDVVCAGKCGDGAALVPPEIADAVVEAVELRSQFERTLVDCLRDGSMYCLGVTSDRSADYRAMYRPAKYAGEVSPEKSRAEAMLAMYDRGVVYVERVNVYNGYDGFEVFFSICTRG
jgi:hypothetical protein